MLSRMEESKGLSRGAELGDISAIGGKAFLTSYQQTKQTMAKPSRSSREGWLGGDRD